MFQSEQINDLAGALAKAQRAIQPALKENVNPFFKSKYADLASVWNACKDPLTENGLAVVQTMGTDNGQMMLYTTLTHASGQWIRSALPINPIKNDPQGLGSAITYLRRYSLAAITGVTTEDDDGNLASSGQGKSSGNGATHLLVSKEQAQELQSLLAQCDDIYRTNFWKYLKGEVKGLVYLTHLPAHMYEKVKAGLIKNVEEQSKQSVEHFG